MAPYIESNPLALHCAQALREELANKLEATPRCIQVWFQNRRQTWKERNAVQGEEATFKIMWNARKATATATSAVQIPIARAVPLCQVGYRRHSLLHMLTSFSHFRGPGKSGRAIACLPLKTG